MKSQIDLQLVSRDISAKFLDRNIPLNDSLVKVASTDEYSQDELFRIAEEANKEVYLKLLDRSEDKYIEFPLADAREIFEKVSSAKSSVEDNSNYEDLPTSTIAFSMDLFEPFSKVAGSPDVMIKEASLANKVYQDSSELQDTLVFANNTFQDLKTEYQKTASRGYALIKQAFLSGTSFKDLENIITDAAPFMAPVVIERYKNDLGNESVIFDLEKNASYTDAEDINKDSSIYKLAQDIEALGAEMMKAAVLQKQLVDQLNSFIDSNELKIEKSELINLDFIKSANVEHLPSIITEDILKVAAVPQFIKNFGYGTAHYGGIAAKVGAGALGVAALGTIAAGGYVGAKQLAAAKNQRVLNSQVVRDTMGIPEHLRRFN